MSSLRLSRRTLIRGAGSIAIALPWLEAMTPERPAEAAAGAAKRFVAVYTPGGTVLESWRPTGTETSFTLSTILQPLEPVKDRVLVLDGVDMTCALGEQNQAGLIAWLTGTPQQGSLTNFAQGPSLDQTLVSSLSAGKRLPSLEQAVRWGTGKSHGLVSPIDIANFATDAAFTPIAPRIDPVQIWKDLFGGVTGESDAQRWEKSILDHVGRRYENLAARLGKDDRLRLEQHLDGIRQLEKDLENAAACTPPALIDTSDYDPFEGLNSSDTGSVVDAVTDAAIPKVGKLMMDMLVMALACDITAVGTLMWSDTEAKHTFPWLGLKQHLSCYMNDCGYQPGPLTTIFTWYAQQHRYLLERMKEVRVAGGRTLLDETIVFFGSHLQNPATHEKTDMPFLLAGNGGGLRTGRWLRKQHESHNNLLAALSGLCGKPVKSFGDPKYCTGVMEGLT
ncbi:MAG TPA: DUF1552 domain-containing protein [Polyangiaceae bacterium]|nr:DUF1552 domain-containing protein [Polyangiaceae bacterium]